MGHEVSVPVLVHEAYLRWLKTQGESSGHAGFRQEDGEGWLINVRGLHCRRALGNTCLSALQGKEAGSVEAPLNDSKGCGGVMRVAPVGLLASADDAFDLGCEIAALTHGHPSGYLASGALALLIARLHLARAIFSGRFSSRGDRAG